tara:strand:+ start:1439 stop:2173 length:735 start_codon:yes stop_codon:yes gene_type:complete
LRETFFYSGTYEDIIQTLGRWRILDLRSLLNKVEYQFSYQAFAKMVSKLERLNYVGSIYYQGYRKYLYLTEKGLKEAGLEKSWPINKDVLLHDLICVNVFSYLLGLGRFDSGGLNLEEAGATTRPDCMLECGKSKLAVEIELTQKASNRIEEKFLKYLRSEEFERVLYVFQKPPVFKAYKKRMDELDENRNPLLKKRFQDKAILLLEPEIKNNTFSLMQSPCFFQGKLTNFKEVLDSAGIFAQS